MKTFLDLVEEVQEKGLCHHCGGCVTFCTAINYGALEMDEAEGPRFGDQEKCIECGLCYSICPEIDELEEETRQKVAWSPPMGRVIETNIARAMDADIRQKATDGGVVTALLLHLFERGHIDGAIVTKRTGPFSRKPWLATSREEIIEAAGFHFDTSHGMKHFSHGYSTYSPSVQEFRPMLKMGLRRVALVGTPCQIEAARKIETMGIVPSDSIKFCLGLFCSGNFAFGDREREKLEELGDFKWENVRKVNLKETLLVHLESGQIQPISLEKLDFMKRYACRFCADYAAEYSDISFGGIGANEGWTTVIKRTAVGRAIFADARGKALELPEAGRDLRRADEALEQIREATVKKQQTATDNRKTLIA